MRSAMRSSMRSAMRSSMRSAMRSICGEASLGKAFRARVECLEPCLRRLEMLEEKYSALGPGRGCVCSLHPFAALVTWPAGPKPSTKHAEIRRWQERCQDLLSLQRLLRRRFLRGGSVPINCRSLSRVLAHLLSYYPCACQQASNHKKDSSSRLFLPAWPRGKMLNYIKL